MGSLLMQWAKSYPTLNNSESLRANLIEDGVDMDWI